MRHKTGFFISYATPAGRSGLIPVGEDYYSYGISQLCPAVRQGGRGKPQPWRAGAAAVCQGGRGKPQPWRAGAAAVRQGGCGRPQPWWAVSAAVRQGGRGKPQPRRAGAAAVCQGGRGKPQPWRAGAAAVRHGALHCVLWNSRASTALQICYGIPKLLSASAPAVRWGVVRYNQREIAQLWKFTAIRAPHIRCGIP
jgi:hypothetical protein